MKRKAIGKFLPVLLAIFLLIPPVSVSAAGAYTVRLADAAGNSVVTAKPGDTVTLTLSIENNPGIIGVGVALQYPAGISLVQRKNVAPKGGFWIDSPSLATQPYLMWWNYALGDNGKLVYTNGNLAQVTFQVSADAAGGEYPITLATPSDKNTTAATDSGGNIQPNTNRPVTGIKAVGCTIRVEGASVPNPQPDTTQPTQPKPGITETTQPTVGVTTPSEPTKATESTIAVETTQPTAGTDAATEATQEDATRDTTAPSAQRNDMAEGLEDTSEKGKREPIGLKNTPATKRMLVALGIVLLIGVTLFITIKKKPDDYQD